MIEPFATQSVRNLQKVRGLIDAVLRMAQEGRYCMDLIQQCNAAIGTLQQVNNALLESHLHTCGKKLASRNAEERQEFIQEILRACMVSQRKK
ncbi:metal-sensing transcriptional repressor [Candidatus Uhrbacteria bacterium]|nr:metal-sensing transcriptional repressor [Candidatus Uhrbacteria bacterium]